MDMENRQTRKLLAFLESRPGFDILQTNGQRRYGRPTESPEPYPPRGSEVFVGKLPRNMFEDELVPVFEKVGSIFEIRMMMDFSGANRGFCFVKYSKPSEAERAIRELNNFEVRPGKYIGVVKSVDNCRLFFGGLPKDKTEEDVYNELVRHVDEVKEVIMYKSVIDKSKNRGFAFVEFRNHRAAAMARRKLVPNRVMFWGQYLQIDWAAPEPDVDEETMATVKVLFIRNVLLSTTEETIGCAMSEGAPNSVTRVKKIKDFAFVHFSTREQAEKAMDYWNGKEIDGSIVEISWAKPSLRTFNSQRRFGPFHYDYSSIEDHHQRFADVYTGHGTLMQGPWSFRNPYFVMPPPTVPRFNPRAVDYEQDPKSESHRAVVSPQDGRVQNPMMVHYLTRGQPPFYTNGYGQETMTASPLAPRGTTTRIQGPVQVPYPFVLPITQPPGYIPRIHTSV